MFRNTRVQACHLSLVSTIGLYSTITSLWNANAPTQCPQMLSSFLFPLSFLWLVTKLGLIYSKPIAHKVRGDLVISKLLKTFICILFPGQKAFIKKSLNFKLTRDSSRFSYQVYACTSKSFNLWSSFIVNSSTSILIVFAHVLHLINVINFSPDLTVLL